MSALESHALAYCAGVITLPLVVWGVLRFDRWRQGRKG